MKGPVDPDKIRAADFFVGSDPFVDDAIPANWDKRIYCCTIPGWPDYRMVIKPLPCGNGFIQPGYIYNGASVGPLRYAGLLAFPKWKHPIATCRHDLRCGMAETAAQRKFADKRFRTDVGVSGTRWEQIKGYIGVRIGALFGFGQEA